MIRKVVIPAAGLGTRFLPASKSQPKEMIPIVDKPGIQYTVEEAVRAGLDDILVVTSRQKNSIEDHFDRSLELERRLEETGKHDELEDVRRIAELADVHYVRQKEPLGFGHAVLMARAHVSGEPFAVMVPDEIVPEPRGDEPSLMEGVIEVFERLNASVLAVHEVPHEEISSYGAIAPEAIDGNVTRITDIIEKPAIGDAPSDLAACGRYVFTPAIFDALDRTRPGVGDEIQLTDAIRLLAKEDAVYAYIHDGPILDVGKKLDYLRATVELALRRDDLAKPFKDYLLQLVERFEDG
ncbi:MAG: UTP--glucose-1-phosphate uridylyltransferase GalU [Actinomycetota bacterium]